MDLAFCGLDDAMAGDFEWWLCHKGHRLTSLQIEYSCCTLEALPCPNLRHLTLEGMVRTPLTAGFGVMLHLAAATSLTWVSFNLVTLSVSRQHDAFGVLARLPNLKCLTWSKVTVRYRQADEDSDPLPHPEPPVSFLQRATGLTYLQTDWQFTPTTLQQFSCLQQLQELHLERLPSTHNAAGLAPLKALRQLKSLSVELGGVWSKSGYADNRRCVRTTSAAVMGISGLQALKSVRLECITEAPLSGLCEQLTCLHVDDFSGTLTPATVPDFTRLTALCDLHLSATVSKAVRGRLQHKAVFSVALLSNLTQLVNLHLSDILLLGAEQQPRSTPLTAWLCRANSAQRVRAAARPLPNFAPLLASSQLRRLWLLSCSLDSSHRYSSISGCGSPWQQVFSVQRPQLSTWFATRVSPSLVPADVQCLVQACPRLSFLSLSHALSDDDDEESWEPCDQPPVGPLLCGPRPWDSDPEAASLVALTALTGLTTLRVTEPCAPGCEALGQLTQLEELFVRDCWQFTRAGFRALTALTRLTALGFQRISQEYPWAPVGEVAAAVQRQMKDCVLGSSGGLCSKLNNPRAQRPTDVHKRLVELVKQNDRRAGRVRVAPNYDDDSD